jgi:hypothetical protein
MNTWQTVFRRELDSAGSWKDRCRKIELGLKEKARDLSARESDLVALQRDFNALHRDFWRSFASSLGCEDPAQTIAACGQKIHSAGYIGTLVAIAAVSVLLANVFWRYSNAPLAVLVCLAGAAGAAGASGIVVLIIDPLVQKGGARKIAAILARETEAFWLTSANGNIALSNLELSPPTGAQWCTRGRTTFLFLRELTARWTIDAFTGEVIWQNSSERSNGNCLCASLASEILRELMASEPRYRQMVDLFDALACLEDDVTFLESLKREAEGRVRELPDAQTEDTRCLPGGVLSIKQGKKLPVR